MPSWTWEELWGPIREQYLSAQQHRNHIVSCPLEGGGLSTTDGYAPENGWVPFLDYYCKSPTGYGMRWVGVGRFQVQSFTPSALTLDSTSQNSWSVESTSCILAFGSNITVTPISATCTFDLNLASFSAQPFMLPAICNQINLNWSSGNVSSMSIYAVSQDGSTSFLIATSTGAVTITPEGDSKYAGSWGIDNGYGAITDTGTDHFPFGESGTVMSSPTGQVAFGFLIQDQPIKLRFVLVPTSILFACTVDYPVFTPVGPKALVYENGQIGDYLFENGPGVRLGNHIWYTPTIGLLDPPSSAGLGYKGSIVDWLCDKRVLFYGVNPSSGLVGGNNLSAECATLYDSYEGNSVGAVAQNSHYFPLPPDPSSPTEAINRAALVNNWSETPPLAGYPAFEYSTTDWSQTTNLVQETWALCQLPRRLINAAGQPDLLAPWGAKQTTPSDLAIGGWYVTDYTPIVGNGETPTWKIVTEYGTSNQQTWGLTTPWHGWFCAVPEPPPIPTGLTATPGHLDMVLTWTASAGATSYNVYVGTVSGGPYTLTMTVTANSATVVGLTTGTTYYFVVTALNIGGMSPYSSQVSGVPT